MSEIHKHTPNTFCWVELATSDALAGKDFYSSLFGWQTHEAPMEGGDPYIMLQLRGKDIGAMYQLIPQQREQGVPPHWLSYISVENADETAERAKSLGGKVVMGPMDVFDAGRMAMLQDPFGATFAIWQPNQHPGAGVINEPGTFCWQELATPDKQAASQFYTGLFNWTPNVQKMGETEYTSFMVGKQPAAGMWELSGEYANIPPHWMVYFAVQNCDEAVEKARNLGAKIANPPTDIPGVGRFSVIQDPQDALFSIIQLENPM
ncbi:MAG: VOC family protein [Calditrichaeota bacterium]|nr:MAG: VOC family protein [Calditrichota bacterium]